MTHAFCKLNHTANERNKHETSLIDILWMSTMYVNYNFQDGIK